MTTETKTEVLTPEQRAKTIERLKAAQDQAASEDWQRGEQSGRVWAMTSAQPAVLLRLANAEEDGKIAGIMQGEPAGEAAFALWRLLYPRDNHGQKGFFENAFGVNDEELISCDEAQGFVEGALAVWHDVRWEI